MVFSQFQKKKSIFTVKKTIFEKVLNSNFDPGFCVIFNYVRSLDELLSYTYFFLICEVFHISNDYKY